MKRISWLLFVFLVLILLTEAAAGRKLRVEVKDGALRSTPTPFGHVLKLLHYGDQVEVIEERGAWLRIRSLAGEGWVHGSILTAKLAALKSGAATLPTSASNDELSLAGKGFNSRVESEYRKQNRTLDYATIDRMESLVVPQEKLLRFVNEGGLSPEGGADAR